jgi:HD-GYP domain-containing protein (c-di-GMP phosphodiesterase class II)/HAMP domain-containing protein
VRVPRDWLRIDANAFRTRIAARLFAVYLLCSLLPVSGFGLYAYQRVRAQLTQDAERALGAECKSAGMAIFERITLADASFLDWLRAPNRRAETRREHPFIRNIASSSLDALRALDALKRRRLLNGEPLLLLLPGPLVRPALVRSAGEGTRVWIAELETDAIFVPERVVGNDQYWIATAEGAAIRPRRDGPNGAAAPLGPAQRSAFAIETPEGSEVAVTWPLFLRSGFGAPDWVIGMSRPTADVHAVLAQFEAIFPLVALLSIALALGASAVQIQRQLRPVEVLADAARRVSKGELSLRVAEGATGEFGDLARAFNEMLAGLERELDRIRTLNDIGIGLSGERNPARLGERILRGAIDLLGVRAGALWLTDASGALTVRASGSLRGPDARFGACSGAELPDALAQRCHETQRALVFDDAHAQPDCDWPAAERALGCSLHSALAIPLRVEDRGLGALLLFSEHPADPAFHDQIELARSVASQAAVALRNAQLVESLQAMFEGLLQLTINAIDAKSGYTGDHCRKVPILAEMIAEAACAIDRGPFKDFSLDDDERFELHIAAMLHDCGKVATPVHVMDKATKLETVVDRIELVRLRFTAAALERELAALRGPGAAFQSREDDELIADLRFVESCNRGGESMSEGARARLRAIARRYHFTDFRGVGCSVLGEDDLRDLSIGRGTLNPTERCVIEEHASTTIRLLQQIPFPPELRNVPAIAGAHHERCDGHGYPLGLTRSQISIQGRILGLADVFEALTSKTRPYKPGKTLSESLAILESMCREGHIDPELHELFVSEKLYLRYAAEHVDPSQIDAAHWQDLEELSDPTRLP